MNEDQVLLSEPLLSDGLLAGEAVAVEELFVMENHFCTNRNEALFWTGGFAAQEEAQAIARAEGRITFEMTPGGEAVNSLVEKLTLPQRHWAYWWSSIRFAKSASGDVHVLIGRYDNESFFFRVELPILLSNSAVTTITFRMEAREAKLMKDLLDLDKLRGDGDLCDESARSAYRKQVVEKQALIDDIIANHNPLAQISKSDAKNLWRVLSYLQSHIKEVVPDIHDLWSAARFREGYRYGKPTNRTAPNLTHELLVPYEKLPTSDLEDRLAVGDINGVRSALEYYFQMTGTDDESHEDPRPTLSYSDKERLVNAIVILSHDDYFLRAAAHSIHENWKKEQLREGKTTDMDVRLSQSFPELSVASQRLATGNVRQDLLAVSIFVFAQEMSVGQAAENFTASLHSLSI